MTKLTTMIFHLLKKARIIWNFIANKSIFHFYLQVKDEFQFNEHISSICVPFANARVNEDVWYRISGFGSTDFVRNTRNITILNSAHLHIFPHKECELVLGEYHDITNRMICAGSSQSHNHVDACTASNF